MHSRLIVKDLLPLEQITKAAEKLASKRVMVGFPGASAGRGEEINNPTLAAVLTDGVTKRNEAGDAYRTETGSPVWNIPPRPFLVPGVESVLPDIAIDMGVAAALALGGHDVAKAVFKDVGQTAENGVKAYMSRPNFAPNAPSTIARKGSSQPLVDTGVLKAAVRYEVRDK